jgi:hypothetical protein
MPNVDEQGKAYELDLAATFGQALFARRRVLKVSASELSRRTAELGYPISRGAIAKMERNHRAGKVDIAEWLVLAAALDIPPVLLLFPHFPDGRYMAVLPNAVAHGREAVSWVSGRTRLPGHPGEDGNLPTAPNDGMTLIAAQESLNRALNARLAVLERIPELQEAWSGESRPDDQMIEMANARIDAARSAIAASYSALWGTEYRPQQKDSRHDG